MIRILAGATLPLLGLATAAFLVGPDLVAGPRGDPLLVAAPPPAEFQLANMDAAKCAPLVTAADGRAIELTGADGRRIVAITLRTGRSGVAAAAPDDEAAKRPPLVIILDEEGRLLAAADPSARPGDCAAFPAPAQSGQI
ncbi:MAG TPA: hypothetical protein VGA77_12270 [Propylenella sp.]